MPRPTRSSSLALRQRSGLAEARLRRARTGQTRGWISALCLLAWALAPGTASAAEGPGVQFLYIEANEGGASGGHVGLRLGDEVFHFLHQTGALRLQRTHWDAFVRTYTQLENRPLHTIGVRADPQQLEFLQHTLRRSHRKEARAFAALNAQRRETALLHNLVPTASGVRVELLVPGAGYFRARPGPSQAIEWIDPQLAQARRQSTGLAHSRLSLPNPLATLDPWKRAAAPGPAARYDFGTRVTDLAAAEAALDAISGKLVPADASFRDLEELPLRDPARQALAARMQQQRHELQTLLAGTRSDWGQALLVGVARHAALERSLAAGHLVVLDAFPEASTQLAGATLRKSPHAETAQALLSIADTEVRAALLDLDASDRAYARLERGANRWLELAASLREGRRLRVHPGPWAPDRGMEKSLELALRPAPQELEAARRQSRDALAQLSAALFQHHAYDVARHNCVSALFDALARSASAESAPAWHGPPPESLSRLVPWLAARWVARHHDVSVDGQLPAERQRRLAEELAAGGGLTTHLREGNVWTASHYAQHPGDSSFLFFTDGVFWSRPLLGVANLLTGALTSAVGLAALPWQRDTLNAGLRGMFWSLPELAFFSVRKGSYPIIPPSQVEAAASR